ncbi:MAG: insulinase family protein [Alphaproteobacteria bacterium]|nr:insulinase family protein [Alphaproteobacteria bacterium]
MTLLKPLAFAVALAAALAVPAHAADVKDIKGPAGTDVWFSEDHTLPMIALTAAFPAGSAYDPAGKEGLATLAASLLDEGAGKYNSNAFHVALSDRAIQLSSSAERDWMIVTLVTLKQNAKDAFALLGTALAHPRFELGTVSRVRGQIVAGLAQDEEDPGSVAAKGFFKMFFRGHPYAHPANGTPEGLGAVAPQDLQQFARTHWVRAGAKIAVSGDVDEATLQALLKSAFGGLPGVAPKPFPPVGGVGAPGVHVLPMNVPQSSIVFGVTGMLRNDRDFIPAYVANHILGGGGFSSRLMIEVREKRGLTYGIGTSLVPYRRAGVLVGQVATKRESVRQTIDVIKDTMNRLQAEGPTQKELDDAKTYLTGSFPLAFDSNAGIAAQLSAFQRAGLSADYVNRRNDLISAVTVEDIQRVSKRLFHAGKLTIVVAGGLGGPHKAAPPPPKKAPARPAAKKPAPPKPAKKS